MNAPAKAAELRPSTIEFELDGQPASSFDLRELGTVPGGMLSLEARHAVMAGLTLGGVIQHAIEEDGQGVDVDGDWPGYTVVDVFVEYEPAAFRNVTLRAEVKQQDSQTADEKTLRSERYFGSVERSFQLPADIDNSQAKAKFDNGVLSLTLPKRQGSSSGHRLEID